MAREWGLPPWEVEERAPLVWVGRWYALEAAKSAPPPHVESIASARDRVTQIKIRA